MEDLETGSRDGFPPMVANDNRQDRSGRRYVTYAAPESRLAGLTAPDGAPHPKFDRMARLACALLQAPRGLVTIIDPQDRQDVLRGTSGLWGLLPHSRTILPAQSFCRIAARRNAVLRIDDAATDPEFGGHPAHTEFGVRAYLGCPVHLPGGMPIGVLCVFDTSPRHWTPRDEARLVDLAACVDELIRLEGALDTAEAAERARIRRVRADRMFLGGVQHEIRTQLNGIIGLSQVMADCESGPETSVLARDIVNCGERLCALMEPLFGTGGTRTDATGRGQPLRTVLQEIETVVAARTVPVQVQLQPHCSLDLELPVALTERLRVLVFEFLHEAIAEVPDGSATVSVSLQGERTLEVSAKIADRAGQEGVLGFGRLQTLVSDAGGRFRRTGPCSFISTLPLERDRAPVAQNVDAA